ncbi:DUF6750 family protein (plasmid) [Serratia fonticola]|uniref:DUF6750 family protein n=1 Tax=Serratia fonticola TaxID=47917 RepID=UPI003B00A77D
MRNFTLFVSVRLWLSLHAARAAAVATLSAILGTFTLPAWAADDMFGMLDSVADGADNSGKSLLKLAKFGGIGLVLVGVGLWVAKKKNPQITWGWILTPMGAGFTLTSVRWMRTVKIKVCGGRLRV